MERSIALRNNNHIVVYSGYDLFGESAILKMKSSDLSETLLTMFQVFSKDFISPVNYYSVKWYISYVYRPERQENRRAQCHQP